MKIIAKHILGDRPTIELEDAFIVEFGEGYEMIAVAIRDGKVDVRSPAGVAIRVEPRAANSVWVSTVPPNQR
jgi:hypothetical protein